MTKWLLIAHSLVWSEIVKMHLTVHSALFLCWLLVPVYNHIKPFTIIIVCSDL